MKGAETTSASEDHLNELVISIQRRFEGLSPPSNCCIFTVLERLRRANEEAYTPSIIAIGPYHRLNASLMPMEDHKLRYLENFLQDNQNYHLKDYIEKVKSWEGEARNCYDKQIDLNSDQFSEMMLLDGIFVIQLFLMASGHRKTLPNDGIFSNCQILAVICLDMALLENQMPFFVVQRLFEMAFKTHQQPMPELLELVWSFFKPVIGKKNLPKLVMDSEVKHFVHAISLSFWPSVMKVTNESSEEIKFTPSATELVAAGVKLRRGESKCLLDIEFENGVLNIPCLTLYEMTECFFRNIIAFEQFYWQNKYLTEYLAFMEHLVESPGDVDLLINKGIIVNWLSNKEAAARMINTVSREAQMSRDYHFHSLSDKLNKHCQRPYNKWKATFKRDYCSNPWVVISVIGAVALLLLTVAQTVLSALSLK